MAEANQVAEVPGAGIERGTAARSRMVAALLSFLWPGLGQLYQRRFATAALFALPAGVIGAWAALQLSHGLLWVGAGMIDERYALTVAVLVTAAGLLRLAAVGHAFLAGRPHNRPRIVEVALAAGLALAVIAPHAYVAADAWLVVEADRGFVANNDLLSAISRPSAGPSAVATSSPSSGASPGAGAPVPAYVPGGSFDPGLNPWPGSDRITFVLLGLDYMTGRFHSLTDTIIVASLAVATGEVSILSIPRDTAGFPLYWGGSTDVTFKINYLLKALQDGSFDAPDPPMLALKREIGFLVGIPVDYYAAIDLEGFPEMVDAVGGVDVENPRTIDDPSTGTEVPAGPVHLDGEDALKYVRSREGVGDNDYTRAGRQQDVLVALERKMLTPAALPRLGTLVSLAGQHIATDFPLETARDYVPDIQAITTVSQCVLGPPYSVHPDMSLTEGTWTSQLDLDLVGGLSVFYFGRDSHYYGLPGIEPADCRG